MRVTKTSESYSLAGNDIDKISESIQNFLRTGDMDSKNITRIRLSIEEILLDMREHFGSEVPCTLTMGRKWGRHFLMLEVRGERFDPLEKKEQPEELSGWGGRLLANMGLTPVYLYKNGKNQILLKLPKKQVNPAIKLVGAVVLAVVSGLLGRMLPPETRALLDTGILTPLFDTFLRALSTVAGPMIFLSVAWGIFSIGDTAALGMIGKKMMLRFTGVTFF